MSHQERDWTYQNQEARPVDGKQQLRPVSLNSVLGLVQPDKLPVELLRGKVESYGGYGEEPKAEHLRAHANEAEVLAQPELLLRVRVGRIGSCDEHAGHCLKQQRNDVEADEDGCDEASWQCKN